jgi:signal transduction histidine kinase/ActR/RegA family two-component response regulator
MSEVSSRACAPIIEAIAQRGLSASDLGGDSSLAKADLPGRANRISWDEYTLFLGRAARLLGGADALEAVAADYMRSSQKSGILRAISSRFIDVRSVFVVAVKWYGPSLFSNTHGSLEFLADGRIRETVEIDPAYRDCPEFFHLMRGSIRALPSVLGQADAVVRMELQQRRAIYTVIPPHALSVWARLRRAFWEGNEGAEALTELMIQHEEVKESYERLAEEMRERERVEESLQHVRKMEAVGQLAGGLAHDINNLLTVINGYAELAADRLAAQHPAQSDLSEICAETQRASGMIKQLLAFSRHQVLLPQRVDVNHLLESIENMLRLLVGEAIELVFAPGEMDGLVMVDPGQLEQVIINLVANARDATPAGGRITIETSTVTAAATSESGAPKRFVELQVRDTGQGMDADTRSRIFEPFFTTKQRGKGTGLGLATVYGIVTQSAGSIDVRSETGKGTAISIRLPRVEGQAASLDDNPAGGIPKGGDETILLVEDDAQVREIASRVLEHAGYSVLQAASGRQAIDLCHSHDGSIGLLVTDVVMPGIDGRELCERLSSLRPELRGALLISGHVDGPLDTDDSLELERAFLHKPFTAKALLQAVRQLLDSQRRSLVRTGTS